MGCPKFDAAQWKGGRDQARLLAEWEEARAILLRVRDLFGVSEVIHALRLEEDAGKTEGMICALLARMDAP